MNIRPATPEDEAEWVRMRYALWPECSAERHALEIQQLLAARQACVVLVAPRTDGSLCGFAEVSVRHDHVEGSTSVPVAYLEGWYVDADVRGHGVGRQLILAAERWAAEHGFKELASDAELDNTASIEAHVACGFAEVCRTVHFIRRLG